VSVATPSLARLGQNCLQIIKQRFELATIDVEEELLRLGELLVIAMVAAVTTGLAFLFSGGAIVIYFWDTARWTAILSICVVLIGLAMIFFLKLNQALIEKPRFMATTLSELEKDASEEERSIKSE
jgi:uncharacterized membrane protein YqjE